ncbi:MAG: sigma-70 family RNA polymerase sigma factor [Planctomycetota bacterium]|nr:MAG: sigma-70 family RNA polymerase sigma factor [Planctomycetota bacterium]
MMASSVAEPSGVSTVRKLKGSVRPPTAAVLKTLSDSDQRLLEMRLEEGAEYVYDAFFESPDAETVLLRDPIETPPPKNSSDAPDDSGVYRLDLDETAPLSADQERRLFLRLNYCRYRVYRVLESFQNKRLTAEATRELLCWERLVRQTRGEIVRVNMPLVLAMTKRTKISGVDHAELISEGNLALLRSVDKFDCNRGFKFSTYACRAILKSFSRVATRTMRYRGHFPVEFDPTLEKSDQIEQKRASLEQDCVEELRAILGKNLARLNHVEEQVIRARFALDEDFIGIDGARRGKTLEQVGLLIGVTKERVRQIQNKALDKLRVVLEEGILAV